ncbi:MAG: hypothetical protein IPJ78_02645 [Gemmatimonadetes bacterium]|nr:hypothetical protein [Gemmatimonadota bacterium]
MSIQKRGTARLFAFGLAHLLSGLLAPPAWSQPVIDLRPTCVRCHLDVVVRVRFDASWPDGGLPPLPDAVSPFATHDWAVSDPIADRVHRFSRDGSYIAPIGGVGAGPGEFRRPALVARWWADSTAVFDEANARLTLFAPDGGLARSQPWSGRKPLHIMLAAGGGFVVSERYDTRLSFGMPLHLFDRKAELVRSFGNTRSARITNEAEVPRLRLPVRAERDGTYWTVAARAPRLQRWSAAGEQLEVWDLPIPEFEALHVTREPRLVGQMFHAIEQLADGRLLVTMAYRDPRWAEALAPSRTVDGQPTIEIDDWGRYFNTRLFVFDPKTRTLVSMRDLDEYIAGNLGGGRLWGIGPGGGNGRLVVMEVSISPEHQRRSPE